MPPANHPAEFGDRARLIASAHSFAERAQPSLEGLAGASNLLFLTGVGFGLAASFLTGLMLDRSPALAANLQ